MSIFRVYREDFKSAGLTCVTAYALVPAITGYSLLPLGIWCCGFVVWVAARAVDSIIHQSRVS